MNEPCTAAAAANCRSKKQCPQPPPPPPPPGTPSLLACSRLTVDQKLSTPCGNVRQVFASRTDAVALAWKVMAWHVMSCHVMCLTSGHRGHVMHALQASGLTNDPVDALLSLSTGS